MLVAYSISLDLIRSLRPVVEQLRAYDGESVKQLVDAASSITRNLAEGSKRSGKDVRRFYWFAHGSGEEVRASLDLADAWGWVVDTRESRVILEAHGSALRAHARS
jgi:four helix bundle protein